MKPYLIFIFILNLSLNLLASVVINEVLYDPSGSDSGYEWIELYNNGDETVDLNGWKILKAGTSFILELSLPEVYIAAHSHFLIGDIYVENTDLTAELSFQNGGSATDGIQLVSPDGQYTDTVLYDEPNTNCLPDDVTDPGQFFAPDVAGGHSLARISDGLDTDNSADDWFDCENPTPGDTNFFPIDLEISSLKIENNGANYEAYIGVKNLSTVGVDNSVANLEITVNNSILSNFELPEICGGDSLEVILELGVFESGYYLTSANLNCLYDNYLENNLMTASFLQGSPPLVLNEILFKPLETSFEWIEIYNKSTCGYLVDNFEIIDESGAKILFSGYIEALDYIVVCENKDHLLLDYPQAIEEKLIQAASWTSLNNTDETLILKDQFEIQFDYLDYNGADCPLNMSLERINPFLGNELDNWGYSIDSATPGWKNSIYVVDLPAESKLNINPDPFSPYRGERTIISYKLPEKLSRVTVRIFDLKGRMKKKLVDQKIQAAEGEFIWDGKGDNNSLLNVGIYLVLMEATSLNSEKVYSQIKTVVVGK
ncbi:MAG: hypothetical protein APR54_09845 [Candidatus Cloacimonas sp. SDB]|nr:MAG: hypothetical protein APR54_09845 [Candidatus Cloacimonas sp. SDB]